MQNSLDRKLALLAEDSTSSEFILADAKDADMAGGMAAPGKKVGQDCFRSMQEYRELIRQNVAQGLIDIMLMSASTSEVLTLKDRIFDESSITPAVRANDATDIWLAEGASYPLQAARPFRTATINHAMCGKAVCDTNNRDLGADLGLYSITFNNDVATDVETLQAYADFRAEAEQKNFRHFLEVFNPNYPAQTIANVPRFVNDSIARALAGVTGRGRPLFLKVAYNGPEAMEQLVSYDSSLVVGILGGSSGTTFDAFHQLWEAKKYGARAALYGRMINNSEHQQTFIQHLRWLADGHLTDPSEAVRSFHSQLSELGIGSLRSLEEDLQSTRRGNAYST